MSEKRGTCQSRALCILDGTKYNENTKQCDCTAWYTEKDQNGSCVQMSMDKMTQICKSRLGDHSLALHDTSRLAKYFCGCEQPNYQFNQGQTQCISSNSKAARESEALVKRLSGSVLLQAENKGKGWYLNPTDGILYDYGSNEYQAIYSFHSLGTTVMNSDLKKIPIVIDAKQMKRAKSVCSTNSVARAYKGKMLIDGRTDVTWYVYPDSCRRLAIKDEATAKIVISTLGKYISNKDFDNMLAKRVRILVPAPSQTTYTKALVLPRPG